MATSATPAVTTEQARPRSPEGARQALRRRKFLDGYQGLSVLYRSLAVRHVASPIFLHRNLRYVTRARSSSAQRGTAEWWKRGKVAPRQPEPDCAGASGAAGPIDSAAGWLAHAGVDTDAGDAGPAALPDSEARHNLEALDTIIRSLRKAGGTQSTAAVVARDKNGGNESTLTLRRLQVQTQADESVAMLPLGKEYSFVLARSVAGKGSTRTWKTLSSASVQERQKAVVMLPNDADTSLRLTVTCGDVVACSLPFTTASLLGGALKASLQLHLHSTTLTKTDILCGKLSCDVDAGIALATRPEFLQNHTRARTGQSSAGAAHAAAAASARRAGTRLKPMPTPLLLRFEFRMWQRDEQSSWVTPPQHIPSCPWCGLRCPDDMYGLLMHLKHYHFRLAIGYTEKDGEGCVIVALNEWRAAHDMAQDATPEDHIEPENGFSLQRKRRASTTSFPTNPTDIMHVKRRRPALRQRFCSRSNLPVSPEDECDSDDEVDIGWMHRCHAATIDDFTDLSTAEKEVMKLWSGYMLDHPVIADSHVAPVCRAFISELQVKLRPFRNNVMMHIAALRDFAIITLQETAELVAHANATFGT